MAKYDLSAQLELQTLKKENVSLLNKLNRKKATEEELREKIRGLEESYTASGNRIENLNLEEIKLSANIRDEYQYEEIEELARDILEHGQLQPALISSENFLLAGYRRYHAIKYLNENKELYPEYSETLPGQLVVYRMDISAIELSDEKLAEIQLAENDQRRAIDNFQLSRLYNRYLEKGFDQKYLAEKFRKSKSFISMVVSINKIEPELVKYLKQFQVYGWSQQKFNALNFSSNADENLLKEYEKLKGMIGIVPLNQLAKCEPVQEQKKAFLKLFGNRLSEEELNSDYFAGLIEQEKATDKKEITNAIRHARSIYKIVENIDEKVFPEKKEFITQMSKNVAMLESLMEKLKN